MGKAFSSDLTVVGPRALPSCLEGKEYLAGSGGQGEGGGSTHLRTMWLWESHRLCVQAFRPPPGTCSGRHTYLPLVWSAWFTQPFPSSLADFCCICQIWSFLFSELFISSQSGMFSGHGFLGEKFSVLETVMGRQREGSEAPRINASCCFLSCYYPPGYHMSWKTYNT